MKRIKIMGLCLLFLLTIQAGAISTLAAPQNSSNKQSEVKFTNDFRRLWFDHVLWTSNYITSATTAGAEDQKQVLERLLKNQEDIGNAIKPFYGENAGNKLTELLKEHIVIAGKIVEAAKAGKGDMVKRLDMEWHRNADDIATFLSTANPHLKKADLKKLLDMHLELITNDLTASLIKDWEARIIAIDEGVTHIIIMSDTIAAAILKK